MEKKSIRDFDVKGKRVFCRVDFNVPMQDGEITDETRILAALPTITYLVENSAKVILATHLGRPKGKVVESLRLNAVAKRFSELVNTQVVKVDDVYGDIVDQAVANLAD